MMSNYNCFNDLYTMSDSNIIFNYDFNLELSTRLVRIINTCTKLHFANQSDNNTSLMENNEQEFNLNDPLYTNADTSDNLRSNYYHKWNLESVDGLFNKSIDKLQDTLLTHIFFSNNFNKNVDNLPLGLKYLQFGNLFNNPVDNLPLGLTHLIFKNTYSKSLNNLPNGLTHLSLNYYLRTIENLPHEIKYLFSYTTIRIKNLSPKHNIEFISNIFFTDGYLPKSLKCMIIDNYILSNIDINNLPTNLGILIIGGSFNHPVDNLPSSLVRIKFGNSFNHPVDNLPSSLVQIKFGNSFNHPVDNLPNTITYLKFGNSFNHPIDNLPKSLKFLILGKKFNHPINMSLSYLTYFSLDNLSYSYDIKTSI